MSSNKKQESSIQISTNYQNILPQPQTIKSQKLNLYQHFFKQVQSCQLENKMQKLKTQNISFCSHTFQNNLNIIILDRTQCNQIIRMSVCFAFFMFEIKLLNVIHRSQSINNLKLLSEGSHGKVFLVQNSFKKKYAIKNIPYSAKVHGTQTKELTKSLRNSIFEYCLCKLFSVLEIGPQIKPSQGFDLIIYQNSVEFCMQVCQKLHFDSIGILKESLKTMHSFNIIHGDIKPQNIMWSPQLKKNVFIDFGLSLLMKEGFGQKTFTFFFGTYNYCCEQMKQLIHKNQFGYVDLYYNDIYSLNKVFDEKIKKGDKNREFENHIEMSDQFVGLHLNFQLMYLIYQRDYEKIVNFIIVNSKFQYFQIIIDFLEENEYENELKQIFLKLKNKFFFPEKESESLIKYHRFNSFNQYRSYEEKTKILENRIGQTFSKFNGAINDIMLFFFIFYNEDITPISLNRSIYLKGQIQQGNMEDQCYWSNFIQYVSNPYVNGQQIYAMFQNLKPRLGIKQWQDCQMTELSLYTKACQISITVRKKYKVDLFNVYQEAENEKKSSKKFEETQSFLLELYPFIPELTTKIQQFKSKAKTEYSQLLKKKLFYELKAIFLDQQPFFLELICSAIDLQFNGLCALYTNKIRDFLKYFTNIKIAKKTKVITKYQFYDLQSKKQSYYIQHQIKMNIFFYKNSTNLIFSFTHQIKALFLPMFLMFTPSKSKSDSFYFQLIAKIVQTGKAINKIYTVEDVAVVFSDFLKKIAFLNVTNLFQKLVDCFQENTFSLIEYYNYQFPQFAVCPLCQIFKSTFKKNTRNKLFLLKVFEKIDKVQISTYQNLCGYIQMRVYICYIFELISKDKIKMIYESNFTRLSSKLQKYKKFSFFFKFLTNYIIFMSKFSVNLNREAKQLSCLILQNYYFYDKQLVACCCLSTYYSKNKDFDTYFSFIKAFFCTKSKQTQQNNFFIFNTCHVLIQTYIVNNKNKKQAIESVYKQIQKQFEADTQSFCNRYPNFIIIVSFILKYEIEQGNNNEKLIKKRLFFAQLLISKCNSYFKTHFRRQMVYLNYLILKNHVYHRNHRMTKIKYLELVRNSHYSFNSYEIINQTIKIRNIKIHHQVLSKVRNLIINRNQNINVDSINLEIKIIGLYKLYCNMQHSYSQTFEERQRIISKLSIP